MTDVFVSKVQSDTRNLLPLTHFAPEKPMAEMLRAKALNDGGSPVGPDGFYTEVRATKAKPPKLAHLIMIVDGFILVSDELRRVLEQFDMGAGQFYPTRIVSKDGADLLSDKHNFWNYGNSKKTLVSEASPRVEPSFNAPDTSQPTSWFPPVDLSDDDIALTTDACGGPDVWAEWRLKTCLFFSGALVAALRREKLDKPFSFRSCRILETF